MKKVWKSRMARFIPYVFALLIIFLMPLFLPGHIQNLLTLVIINAIFAMSLNILAGYTGLMSLGHAAYFGTGGYTVAILMQKLDITSFWAVAPAGIVMAAIMAALLGLVALRVSGNYFLLITFGLSALLAAIASKWYAMTNGTDGIANMPMPVINIFDIEFNYTGFYFFVAIIFIIFYFLMYRFIHSPFGKALQGIRENEPRMRVLGYNAWLYKYIAFIVAGAGAGFAGVLFSHYNGVIIPYHLDIAESTLGLLICIIGGLGIIWGPVIGSVVVVLVQYFSSIYFPERWPLVLGIVFVVSVMFLRGGIAARLIKLWNKVIYGST